MTSVRLPLASMIIGLLCVTLGAAPLKLNERMTTKVGPEAPATFELAIDKPAVLTVVARAAAVGHDLWIRVQDADGQEVAYADFDIDGDFGAEQMATTISKAGRYTVIVGALDGEGDVHIAAGLLSFDGIVRSARDVPAKPIARDERQEIRVEAGSPLFFSFTATEDGELTASTRGTEGDFTLAIYVGEAFGRPVGTADEDRRGNPTQELLTVSVKKGDYVLVKVQSLADVSVGTLLLQAQ